MQIFSIISAGIFKRKHSGCCRLVPSPLSEAAGLGGIVKVGEDGYQTVKVGEDGYRTVKL
jgi:hypothetical protein